jgi:DNA-binding NtrC family response regulator
MRGGEPNVTEKPDEVRILALVTPEKQEQIGYQVAPLGVKIDFVSKAGELSHLALTRISYQVVLLPAALPDNGWWQLWGELALLHPRPEILVYAPTASFRLWSGVLEIGGYDVIVEPFTDQDLQQAILRAATSFKERCLSENANE